MRGRSVRSDHVRAIGPIVALLVAALLHVETARAQSTLRVPQDFPTIQAAINAAMNGDTVLVSSGTYVETINFLGKAITVMGQGAKTTVIDGNQADSVVTFASGEGPGSVLTGFTIRNGRSSFDTPGFGDGGGIWIQNSSPTVTRNVIVRNRACVGVGISIGFGSPLIRWNVIADNIQFGCSGGTGGGGIGIRGNSTAQILDNVIERNSMGSSNGGGGISLFAAGTPTIRGNIIRSNSVTGVSPCAQGGGIWLVNQSDAVIAGNLIIGNSAGCGGGIYWLVPSGASGPRLVNNTIANNTAPQGSQILADGFDAQTLVINNIIVAAAGQTAVYCGDFNDLNPPMFKSNDVFSPGGIRYGGICSDQTGANGNISEDPLFRAPSQGDYHLRPASPAIDAGDNTAPSLPATDLDGDARIIDGNGDSTSVVDMGADEALFVPSRTSVSIDIRPGVDPNVINPRSQEAVPVAILSSMGFDAPTSVNPSTLTFGRTGDELSFVSCSPTPQDVNSDGLPDLICFFNSAQMGFTGVKRLDTVGVIKGALMNGTLIIGTDSISVIVQ